MLTTHNLLIDRFFNFLVRFAGMRQEDYHINLFESRHGYSSTVAGVLEKFNVAAFVFSGGGEVGRRAVLWGQFGITAMRLKYVDERKHTAQSDSIIVGSNPTLPTFHGSFKPFCQYIKTVTSRFFTLLHDAFLQAEDKKLPQPTESNNTRADRPCQRETDAFYELDTLTGGKHGLYVVYSNR